MNNTDIPTADYSFSGNEVSAIVEAALAALLCCEGEILDESENSTPVRWDDTYDVSDATPELYETIAAEVNALDECDDDDEGGKAIRWAAHEYIAKLGAGAFGHDLILTRNGHGAGFWDKGIGAIGDVLTVWAKSLGSLNLFEGYGDTLGMFHAE